MKRLAVGIGFLIILSILLWGAALPAAAQPVNQQSDVIRGALLYDSWFDTLNQPPPAGNSPIWSRQVTNTRSGPDTWRCEVCHGWDYQGQDGANRSGTNFTGFPGVLKAGQTLKPDELIAVLKGQKDPQHDFSKLGLADSDLNALAVFLSTAAVDDNQYIDPLSLKVSGGDAKHGQTLYEASCSSCHAKDAGLTVTVDGKATQMRLDSLPMALSQISTIDPWRFLHKTRFGTPGTPMTIGYELGWTAQDGRDVLLYVQSLVPAAAQPTNLEPWRVVHPPVPGGPPKNIFSGILTAFTAVATGLGFNILIGAALVGIILLLVWALRAKK